MGTTGKSEQTVFILIPSAAKVGAAFGSYIVWLCEWPDFRAYFVNTINPPSRIGDGSRNCLRPFSMLPRKRLPMTNSFLRMARLDSSQTLAYVQLTSSYVCLDQKEPTTRPTGNCSARPFEPIQTISKAGLDSKKRREPDREADWYSASLWSIRESAARRKIDPRTLYPFALSFYLHLTRYPTDASWANFVLKKGRILFV